MSVHPIPNVPGVVGQQIDTDDARLHVMLADGAESAMLQVGRRSDGAVLDIMLDAAALDQLAAELQQAAAGIIQAMQLVGGMFGPELGVQLAMKETDPRKVFAWAWDLFNNDPSLLADEDAQEQADQMQQSQMALGMAQPAMDMVQKGSAAVKNVAQAHAQDGMDIGALLQTAQETLGKDPKAQQQIMDMMNGQAPAAN